ncbi:hypothetical protein QQ045_022809 [Rhodiola kirilowii]
MASSYEQRNHVPEDDEGMAFGRSNKGLRIFLVWLSLFVSSLAGGIVMVWWELKYHPAYSQLWMVPCGLVLFGTPVIVWFSILVSDILNPDHVCKGTELSFGSVKCLESQETRIRVHDEPDKLQKQSGCVLIDEL